MQKQPSQLIALGLLVCFLTGELFAQPWEGVRLSGVLVFGLSDPCAVAALASPAFSSPHFRSRPRQQTFGGVLSPVTRRKAFQRLGIGAIVATALAVPQELFAQATAAPSQGPSRAVPTNPEVVNLARRYLTAAVLEQKRFVLSSSDNRVWTAAAGLFKSTADPQRMGIYMNNLFIQALTQLKIQSGTPATPELDARLARAMWNLLPDRVIPAAKANEHPLVHDDAFLDLRLAVYGVPSNPTPATVNQWADELGMPNAQIRSAMQVLQRQGSQALTYDLMFSLSRRIDAFRARLRSPRPPTAKDFLLQILDPYLVLVEASTMSGQSVGTAFDDQVSSLFDSFFPGAQQKGALGNFVKTRRAGTFSGPLMGTVIDAMKTRGYWLDPSQDRYFIICEIKTEIPVGQGGVDSVLLAQRIGMAKQPAGVGNTLPVLKHVVIFEDVWEDQDHKGQSILVTGQFQTFPPTVIAALEQLGLNAAKVLAAMNRIKVEEYRGLNRDERREIGLEGVGVHELKHKFDEFRGFFEGQNPYNLEISAYLAAMVYGRNPLDESLALMLLANGYLATLNQNQVSRPLTPEEDSIQVDASIIVHDIADLIPADGLVFDRRTVEQNLRQWAKNYYAERRRARSLMPSLEDFKPLVDIFDKNFDARKKKAALQIPALWPFSPKTFPVERRFLLAA